MSSNEMIKDNIISFRRHFHRPMASSRSRCTLCGKENATTRCVGYSQEFCFKYDVEHRQESSKQLDQIELE